MAMSAVQAFQLLRSCPASLSSRAFVGSIAGRHTSHLLGHRYYSEGEKKEEQGTPKIAEHGKGADVKPPEQTPTPEQVALEKLKKKEEEVVDLTSRLRYLQADFLNLQRNAAREKEHARDFAITRFASDLLETADVLEMALKSVPSEFTKPTEPQSSESSSPPSPHKTAQGCLLDLYTGVEMTHRQLLQTLFKHHIKPFDPTGDKFDPNFHEALYQAPIPGKEPGTVVDCQKAGYMIKDRVLRAAQVGVAQEAS